MKGSFNYPPVSFIGLVQEFGSHLPTSALQKLFDTETPNIPFPSWTIQIVRTITHLYIEWNSLLAKKGEQNGAFPKNL